ncbi:hypothetical protein [Terrimonas pollutisoli]|uniref:hypothetical protein n=1 Tax=Terrimonas pollutisoli TaxID=3034147 RepID=UPI0023EC432C|nr:hypothetical protein [Terrimonas sp. H1YJ31]
MRTLEKIKWFLSGIADVSLGYNEINFFQADTLEDEQVGYSFDTAGKSLTTGQEGDWQKEWIAIASDQMGDPFIVDTSSTNLRVLSAAHGEGAWEPFIVADNLGSFKSIISILNDVSKKRTNPVDLEKNPITEKERQNALREIEQQNPDSELWFWENYLEND